MNLEKYFKEIRKAAKDKVLIGLSGQVGAGKTSILNILKEKGVYTISCDEITNKVLTNKKCYSKILIEFDNVVDSDGRLNKKKLAKIVFGSKPKREYLESLLHPFILKDIIPLIKQSPKRIVVIEAPLLFESGFYKYMDLNICVYSSLKNQIIRLRNRGWTKNEILSRIKSQFSTDIKCKMSDIIIDNDKSISCLEEQISLLYNSLSKI